MVFLLVVIDLPKKKKKGHFGLVGEIIHIQNGKRFGPWPVDIHFYKNK